MGRNQVSPARSPYASGYVGTPTFTIGAENTGAGTIAVSIQMNQAGGKASAIRTAVDAYLSDDANGDSVVATAPSGGWAIGTDGVLIPIVTGKMAKLVSEADGDIDLVITEAGAKTLYLIIVLPDGRLAPSGAITFA